MTAELATAGHPASIALARKERQMSKRIGVVVGGGDCPGLNAVIRSVAKAAAQRDWETIGILGGFDGLLPPGNYRRLDYQALDGLLVRGGTILGTANRGQFTAKVGHGESRGLPVELLDNVKRGMSDLGLSALVAIGGDGSLSIAQQLHEYGIPIVGVPKTIDNDLEGTLWTFGFDSAVACATDAIDRLHTTAESHRRVMVLELMGRYAGWIAMFAGVAGGADVILIPEIPFDFEAICRKIQDREKHGKQFTIVVVAEGAREKGGDFVTSGGAVENREARLGGIGATVAKEIESRTGKESRVCVLGHLQRGGSPTSFDRALCSIFGAEVVELIAAEDFGKMVAFQGSQMGSIKISEAVGKLKTVRPDGSFARTARALGICLGD
jgi:6-phosphofructokinase 1